MSEKLKYPVFILCLMLSIVITSCNRDDKLTNDAIEVIDTGRVIDLKASALLNYLDNFKAPEGVMLFTLTLDSEGNLYYTTSLNEIRKIDSNGIDTVFYKDRINPYFMDWLDNIMVVLIYEGGRVKLVEIDRFGREIALHTPDFEPKEDFHYMACIPNTRIVCLSNGGRKTRGSTIGYLYDLDTRELTTLRNIEYDDTYGLQPLSSGELLLLMTKGSPVLVNLKGTDFTYTKWWDSDEVIYNLFFDKTTGDYYSCKNKTDTSDCMYYISKSTGELFYILDVEAPILYSSVMNNGMLYYIDTTTDGNSKHIKYINIKKLKDEVMSAPVTLYISLGSSPSDPLAVYIDEYRKINPRVKIIINKYQHDWENDLQAEQLMALDIMTGKTKTDIMIYGMRERQYLWDLGLLRNLNGFDMLKDTINNPNLIDGVKNLCIVKDSDLFLGLPVDLSFSLYLMENRLYAKYKIPMLSLGDTYEDALRTGREYCLDYDENGVPDVYLFWDRHPAERTFNFTPSYGINAHNGFKPMFDSNPFIRYMEDNQHPVYYDFNLPYTFSESNFRAFSQIMDYPILLRNFDFDSLRLSLPSFVDGYDVYTPTPDDRDKFTLWVCKDEIANLFTGIEISGNMVGISEQSESPVEAAEFLAGFFNEAFQIKNGTVPLYKNVSNKIIFSNYPSNFEECVSYVYRNYVECYIIPRFFYWMNDIVYAEYINSGLSLTDVGTILQKEAIKRIKG